MSLTQFRIDDGPHAMDRLRLFARDGVEAVEAFIGREVMDVWGRIERAACRTKTVDL
jgi:hypothetical protein